MIYARTSVAWGVNGGREATHRAVDKSKAPRALRVAIPSAVLRGARLVERRQTAIGRHLAEKVQRIVEPTGELRDVDVERKTPGSARASSGTQEVDPRAALAEDEAQGVAAGRDAEGAGVLDALQGAVLRTRRSVGADRLVHAG